MTDHRRPRPPNRNARPLEPSNHAGSNQITNTRAAEPLADGISREPSNHAGSSALAFQTGGYRADAATTPDLAAALTRMQAAGLVLTADGERLHYKSPVPLTPAQIEFLRQHKAELLRLLTPPPLSLEDRESIQEAIAERAAIREFDGGETREQAEHEARSAMRVYQYRITDKPTTWLTLIAPGCDLEEARRVITGQFGAERVLDVQPYEWRTSP